MPATTRRKSASFRKIRGWARKRSLTRIVSRVALVQRARERVVRCARRDDGARSGAHRLGGEVALGVILRVQKFAEGHEVAAEELAVEGTEEVQTVLVQREAQEPRRVEAVGSSGSRGIGGRAQRCINIRHRVAWGGRSQATGRERDRTRLERLVGAGERRIERGVHGGVAERVAGVGGDRACRLETDDAGVNRRDAIGGAGEGPVAIENRVLLDVVRRDDEVRLVVAEAHQSAVPLVVNIALFREAVADGKLEAVKVLVEQDVDHTADGVRAVDGRRAVLEHLDALDQRGGKQVHVRELPAPGRLGGGVGEAAAVEQHERRQIVNGDERAAERGFTVDAGVGLAEVAASSGDCGHRAGEHAFHVFLARGVARHPVHGVHWRGPDFPGGRDVRAGDYHALRRRCFWSRLLRVGRARRQKPATQTDQQQRPPGGEGCCLAGYCHETTGLLAATSARGKLPLP